MQTVLDTYRKGFIPIKSGLQNVLEAPAMCHSLANICFIYNLPCLFHLGVVEISLMKMRYECWLFCYFVDNTSGYKTREYIDK